MASKENPAGPTPPQNEPAPDPDEDDLDDLDDVLDEFSAAKISPPTSSSAPTTTSNPGPSGPGRPNQNASATPPTPNAQHSNTSATPLPPEALAADEAVAKEEADFAAQLQTGMADMMRELESNPEMARQFEQMMAQIGAPGGLEEELAGASAGTAATPSHTTSSGHKPGPENSPETSASNPSLGSAPAPVPGADFQDTIKRTMDRMRTSNASASAASDPSNPASTSSAEADMMSALLASLGPGGAANGADGPDTDPDAMSAMLLNLMESLTNKEILYEPMKELSTKFPAWLSERKPGGPKASSLTSEEELKRYEEQASLVGEIVARFERSGYSDGDAADREYVVERMQKMQALGAPPGELVGDMGVAGEMLGDADTGCPQQ